MRNLSLIGGILVLLGIGGLVFKVIPLHSTEEVVKIGPITATRDVEHDFVILPYAAALLVVAGAFLVVVGRRQS